jgi:hypothetical protein
MGQQQLILLVLATVIVGIAIVVGIAAFTENSAKANADAMIHDGVRVANDMQAWKKKPGAFGGQASTQEAAVVADPKNFAGATWATLGYGAAGNYTNLNGTFTIAVGAAETTITGTNTVEGNIVQVKVCGITGRTVAAAVTQIGGTPTGATATCTPTPVAG